MKERLTGAIILVALLVLLVPELLTGPDSKQPAKPAGADGAQLRNYTIDLNDGANGQPPPPTAPAVAVSDDPVGVATPEAESASPPVAEVSPPVDDAARSQGKPMGSGADPSAAAPEAPTAEAAKPAASAKSAEAPPSSADDRPRSAFGPNARPQPEKPASAARSDAAPTASEASKAAAAKAEAARAAAKADAQRAEAAKAEAARVAAAKAEGAKSPSAAKPSGSKGYAVQLGVFGSRDNAERLAKQVKGSGFPVLVNETSGKDGKKLYWVRVGPEPDQAGATALSGKLKAAGHKDARVVAYP